MSAFYTEPEHEDTRFRVAYETSDGTKYESLIDANTLSIVYPSIMAEWDNNVINNVRLFDPDGSEIKAPRSIAPAEVSGWSDQDWREVRNAVDYAAVSLRDPKTA